MKNDGFRAGEIEFELMRSNEPEILLNRSGPYLRHKPEGESPQAEYWKCSG
jgi:hypothetical protein